MYEAANMQAWTGRIDAEEGEAGRRWHQIVQPLAAGATHGIALLGFACDAGVRRNHGRPGAQQGPAAIRAMLGNMPVHRCKQVFDAGNVTCTTDAQGDGLEQAQDELATAVAGALSLGLLPIALGGGHEIAYGSFSGLARHLEPLERAPRVGIVNLDAHFDLRMADKASSGTPFRQIAEDCAARGWDFHYCCLGISRFANTEALFQRAEQLGVHWRSDEDMDAAHLGETLDRLHAFLQDLDHVYLTVCLDVLPSAVAPGVSAPAARGVALEVIEPIIDAVARSGKLRVADIAELNPAHDIDNRTARVAARLVARIAEHTAT